MCETTGTDAIDDWVILGDMILNSREEPLPAPQNAIAKKKTPTRLSANGDFC
jgi:hypothetical protein